MYGGYGLRRWRFKHSLRWANWILDFIYELASTSRETSCLFYSFSWRIFAEQMQQHSIPSICHKAWTCLSRAFVLWHVSYTARQIYKTGNKMLSAAVPVGLIFWPKQILETIRKMLPNWTLFSVCSGNIRPHVVQHFVIILEKLSGIGMLSENQGCAWACFPDLC